MQIFIYTDYSKKDLNFESSRIRKNFKGMLEFQNENYTIKEGTGFYNIAQYFTLNDVSIIDRLEFKKKSKNCLAVLYTEEEYESSILSKGEKDEYILKSSTISRLNSFDYLICPSIEAKKLLFSNGVNSKIYVLPMSVKLSKFDLTNSLIKDVFYRMAGFENSNKLCFSIVKEDDKAAIKNIEIIASKFTNLKFIIIVDSKNKRLLKKYKKEFNKYFPNIYIYDLLEEDVYVSLIYNSIIFLSVNSYKGNVIALSESMASKTQIFALNSSVYNDLIIDNETGYLYNDLGSLMNGMNDYMNGYLASTVESAYNYIKDYSVQKLGESLINIYKEIEGDIKYD